MDWTAVGAVGTVIATITGLAIWFTPKEPVSSSERTTEHLNDHIDDQKQKIESLHQEKELVVLEKQELSAELQKTKDELAKVIKENPSHDPQVEKARGLSESGEYLEADKEYEQAFAQGVKITAKGLFERGLNLVLALQYEEALQLHAQAADLAKDDPEILNGYASLLDDLGQYEKAEKVFRAAISFAIEAEEKHSLFNNLGLCLQKLGKIIEARSWHEQSIEIKEIFYPEAHPAKATAYNNLGLLEASEGNYSKALNWYQKALEMRETLYSGPHLDKATSYNNLGSLEASENNYSEARSWYQKVLEMLETLYSGPHPSKAKSYNNLGALEKAEGNYSEARSWYQKVLEMLETLYSGPHPDKATNYNNLGSLEAAGGNYSEARKWYQKDREMLETLYSGPHPDIATSYNNLGALELTLENYAEAWKWFSKAVEMLEEHWPNTPNAIRYRGNLEILRKIWKEAGGKPPTTP